MFCNQLLYIQSNVKNKTPHHQGHHKVLKETQTSEQKEGKTKGLSRLISVEKNVGNSCGELQCLLGLK